jgi:hypothetical protein
MMVTVAALTVATVEVALAQKEQDYQVAMDYTHL